MSAARGMDGPQCTAAVGESCEDDGGCFPATRGERCCGTFPVPVDVFGYRDSRVAEGVGHPRDAEMVKALVPARFETKTCGHGLSTT